MGFVLLKIGRDASNDFQLNREEVAPQHLELFVDIEGNVYLTDLKTASGTFVNQQRIEDTVEIYSGDEVKIANSIKFNWEAAIRKALANSFSIGSNAKNDIQLEGSDVDPFHIQLFKDFKDIIYVKDLDTVHGTFVNGYRVQTAIVLNDGDRLKLGKTEYDWKKLFIDKTFPIVHELVPPKLEKTVEENPISFEPQPEVKIVEVVKPTERKNTPSNLTNQVEEKTPVKKMLSKKGWIKLLVIIGIDILLVLWLMKMFS